MKFVSPSDVPYQRNPFFTGREQILQQLHQLLRQQQTVALTQSYALSGLGGIGKTQTAIEYAYRSFQDYSLVFWMGAETAESLQVGFLSMATLLHLPEHLEQDQRKMVAAVIHWLNSHSDWLLIVDNVEDVGLVKSFLPAARRGSLLFTTRLPDLGTLACMLEVEPMSPEEGSHLLLRRAGSIGPQPALEGLAPQEKRAIRTLASALDGLPLALDQAGAYIGKTHCSWSAFLHLLQTSPVQVLNDRDASATHPLSVARTFTLSFERLQQSHPAAAELLTLCCFLAPDGIPEALLTAPVAQLNPALQSVVSDPFHFNVILQELLASSLISRSAQARTIMVHRLVQMVLTQGMPEATQKAWLQRVVCLLSQAFSLDQHTLNADQWPWCEQVLPHALLAISQAERWQLTSPAYGSLLAKAATYLYQRARYRQAEEFYRRARCIQEQRLGPAHPELAVVLTGLANTHHQQGKYQQSETAYRRAIALVEAGPGEDDLQLACLLQGLAFLLFERSRYKEAEELYLRALRLREQAPADTHPNLAIALNDLADLYNYQGRYNEAEPLYRRALQIREETVGPDHYDVAGSLNSLGLLYLRRGLYNKAEPLFLRSLRVHEQVVGPEHPEVGALANNLAVLYRKQGNYQEAEPLFLRAVRIREHIFGPDHPYTAFFVDNLAVLYRTQGRYQEAEQLHRRVLQIYEQTHEPEHPIIANTLSNLVQLLCEQGRETEAEAWALRALRIREQALGPEHPEVATSLVNLAVLYLQQGKDEQAEPLFQRALRIREQALGPEHPEVGYALRGLAGVYGKRDRYEEAESLLQCALRLWEQMMGSEHPEMALLLQELADLSGKQGRYEEAERLSQRALAIWERRHEPHHPARQACLRHSAVLQRQWQQGQAANSEREQGV